MTYYHLLFDQHEIIYANGAPTESFHPGDLSLTGLDRAARQEVLELFPELSTRTASYGPAAKPVLRGFEAKALGSIGPF